MASIHTTLSHIVVLGIFLSGCGVVMMELLLALQEILSARVFAFSLSFIISWLVLENIVLSSDIESAKATKDNTTTEGERMLIRRLAIANQRFNVISLRLGEETAAHSATAARLDIIQDKSLSVMHWNLLASKAIALSYIERVQRRKIKATTRIMKRRASFD